MALGADRTDGTPSLNRSGLDRVPLIGTRPPGGRHQGARHLMPQTRRIRGCVRTSGTCPSLHGRDRPSARQPNKALAKGPPIHGASPMARAPSRPIPRSMAGPSLLAFILVSKFDDHIPLYRLNEIFARMGAARRRQRGSDHVWMAPAGQGLFGRCWRGFGCGHVYGVWIAARWLRALMNVRGRFGPNQWRALQGAPVRTGCPWRYVRHLPSSHDALAFSVG